MSDDGFKHIKVTAPEEDDVVIVAGRSEEPVPTLAPEPESSPEPEPAPQPEPEKPKVKPQATSEPEATLKPKATPKPKVKDDYHETTLEDLEDRSMPFAQKAVIAAAVIFIVVAIVYCVFFL